MGNLNDDPTFGALAAAQRRIDLYEMESTQYRSDLADVCTERDDYRAKLNRAELRNDSLRAQIASFAPPAKHPDDHRISVEWDYVGGATVVVDGNFDRHSGGLWDVEMDSVYLHGVSIDALVTGSVRTELRGVVERALEAAYQDNREELAA